MKSEKTLRLYGEGDRNEFKKSKNVIIIIARFRLGMPRTAAALSVSVK